jgi:hypothetical protein
VKIKLPLEIIQRQASVATLTNVCVSSKQGIFVEQYASYPFLREYSVPVGLLFTANPLMLDITTWTFSIPVVNICVVRLLP